MSRGERAVLWCAMEGWDFSAAAVLGRHPARQLEAQSHTPVLSTRASVQTLLMHLRFVISRLVPLPYLKENSLSATFKILLVGFSRELSYHDLVRARAPEPGGSSWAQLVFQSRWQRWEGRRFL